MFKRIFDVLCRPMNRAGFGIMGVFMIVWGSWVASPFWSAFGSAKMFSVLLALVPELGVGLIAILLGALILYFLVTGRTKSLMWIAFCCMYFWGLFAFFCFVGDWHNTGGVTYSMLAFYSTFVYENIRINKRNEQSQ